MPTIFQNETENMRKVSWVCEVNKSDIGKQLKSYKSHGTWELGRILSVNSWRRAKQQGWEQGAGFKE